MSKIIFKAGEATVYSEGKDVTAAMPEILIGAVDGPVGQAFANLMAQSKGHTAMFAVRDINQLVRPVCMTVPKVTLKGSTDVGLFGGVVQAATADAILDCVIEGIIPKDQANDLCIISLVWIDPGCIPLEKEGKLVFTENVTFTSPSYASSVVLGRSTNGLDLWKDKLGKSLKKLQSEDSLLTE